MKNSVEHTRRVVNHVEVSFTQREWNLAKDGMSKLFKEKDNISRQNIYKIISDINKNVFSKEIIFVDPNHDNDQEKEEKEDSYRLFDKVKVLLSFFCCCVLLTDGIVTTKQNTMCCHCN